MVGFSHVLQEHSIRNGTKCTLSLYIKIHIIILLLWIDVYIYIDPWGNDYICSSYQHLLTIMAESVLYLLLLTGHIQEYLNICEMM